MPPKKSAAAKAPPVTTPPLDGCLIALSGTFPGYTQPSIEKNLILPLGASLSKTVTKPAGTTHLVTTEADFIKVSVKVKQALDLDLQIVSIKWLEDCLAQSKKLDEASYSVDGTSTTATAKASSVAGSKKRAASSDDDDDSQKVAPPKKKGGAKAKAAVASTSKPDLTMTIQSKIKDEDVEMNVAKSKDMLIPLDEHCPLQNYRVYLDDSNLIYDASLNQTNASHNNNKFYRIQLLHNGKGHYQVWTRWGRVGDNGQKAMLGDGSLDDALRQFESKFKGKSGLAWANRGDKAKSGKYTFIEKSYGEDEDEEAGPATKVKEEEEEKAESKLAPAIQELMELIFNQQYFAATMSDLNYDVQKLPLGKLGKSTILRGYSALKELSELISDSTLAQSKYDTSYQNATEELSNSFYSLIPHAFGRNRPPIINSNDMLKREVDLLDSLSDMKEASNIMKKEPKDEEKINALDRQFKGLGMDEMTPLKKGTPEFDNLANYLHDTKGSTHNVKYQIADIFRIERQGEKERFQKAKFGTGRDTRLLWHGSRATNFGGILSQGLRIAPPEAPVNGYMFGKGIYLADMSSKSAGYCCSSVSNGHALLLLCEAELGDPMHTLTNASYSAAEDSKRNGSISTWGQGRMGPKLWKDAECVHESLKGVTMPDTTVKPDNTNVSGASLYYNEYITYDVSQVRLRYLFRVRM